MRASRSASSSQALISRSASSRAGIPVGKRDWRRLSRFTFRSRRSSDVRRARRAETDLALPVRDVGWVLVAEAGCFGVAVFRRDAAVWEGALVAPVALGWEAVFLRPPIAVFPPAR